ncbi:MAG: tRNA (cytidine/uridine-2-O-)-methyltransferase [Halanaerobiales bacterium]|nr:tRNA (cytidine/uridine-2-O-)-methyltransferase [Halanaerobiales bacterium]
MRIVLVEPEIPQNTGNIARTCAVTGSSLYLVRPLGFSTDDRYLKRAGLDYWDKLDVHYFDSLEELMGDFPDNNFYFATTKAANSYDEVAYTYDDFLVFGKETAGLPEDLLKRNLDRCIRIPMADEIRSLNLANSVAIILYEALRQLGFPGLEKKGKFKGKGE